MLQKEFYTKIKNDVSRVLNVPVQVKVERDERDTFIIMSSKEFDYTMVETINTKQLETIISDEKLWDQYISGLINNIFNKAYSVIKDDIKRIATAYDYFLKNCVKRIEWPADVKGMNLPYETLDIIGSQVYMHRICAHIQTLGFLSQHSDARTYLNMEWSIGVILRSCILDSLHIIAWGTDTNLISAIVSDSFFRHPNEIPTDLKNKMEAYGEYFNVHKIKYPGNEIAMENILKKFRKHKMVNTMKYENIYSHYSKYDHFSLIPLIFDKSDFQKIDLMVSALHLIKHALSSLLTLNLESHKQDFDQILGVSMEKDNEGLYIFTNKH